jgi:hypothetical protein
MKKFIAILALILTISAKAQIPASDSIPQIDSSEVKIPLQFKTKQVLLIFDCLEQKTPQVLNLGSQIAKAIDTAAYDSEQLITITVESGFIRDVYMTMGVQQERFTSGINDEIKAALLPQIMNYSWLMRQLQGIMQINSGLVEQRVQRAFATIKQMK